MIDALATPLASPELRAAAKAYLDLARSEVSDDPIRGLATALNLLTSAHLGVSGEDLKDVRFDQAELPKIGRAYGGSLAALFLTFGFITDAQALVATLLLGMEIQSQHRLLVGLTALRTIFGDLDLGKKG